MSHFLREGIFTSRNDNNLSRVKKNQAKSGQIWPTWRALRIIRNHPFSTGVKTINSTGTRKNMCENINTKKKTPRFAYLPSFSLSFSYPLMPSPLTQEPLLVAVLTSLWNHLSPLSLLLSSSLSSPPLSYSS